MPDAHVKLQLSQDQALVLSDWLDRVMGETTFDQLADSDPAVWSALYAISGTLDKSLVGIFAPDYSRQLAAARERLLDELGDHYRSRAQQTPGGNEPGH